MFRSMTALSAIPRAVAGLILSIIAVNAAAEEYYTIKVNWNARPGIAADDWVFTQFYPVPGAGKAAAEEGTL